MRTGKLLAAAAIGTALWKYFRPAAKATKAEGHAAAFADAETHPENFDQTRSAGPDGMRDGSHYHITWSLGPGRRAKESNDAIAALGWQVLAEPVSIALQPARWTATQPRRHSGSA